MAIKVNDNRRKFLGFICFGAVAVFLWRFFDWLNLKDKAQPVTVGDNFKAQETDGKLIFFNKKGEKIFSINDEGEMEIGD